jgi:hypothetical protein
MRLGFTFYNFFLSIAAGKAAFSNFFSSAPSIF